MVGLLACSLQLLEIPTKHQQSAYEGTRQSMTAHFLLLAPPGTVGGPLEGRVVLGGDYLGTCEQPQYCSLRLCVGIGWPRSRRCCGSCQQAEGCWGLAALPVAQRCAECHCQQSSAASRPPWPACGAAGPLARAPGPSWAPWPSQIPWQPSRSSW